MKDAKFHSTKALPAAGASNTSNSIDLSVATTFPNEWRLVNLEVAIPAMADHTNTSATATLTLQDSADGVTFANTSPLISIPVPGVASTGSSAATVKVPVPPAVRRYVQFK